ncbi:MAG TPA: ABC transporter permease [Candidatus Dormibacteraeota bacterium]|nr:ABC transporter permease [Candidatus Dormibacteraeota bacterium]
MSSQPSALPNHPPTLSGILRALLRADLTVQLRNGRALVLTFLPPLAVLYGLSTAKRGAQLGGPIVSVALALTLGIALIAILGYTASVARDRELGVFQRLRVTPAPTWTIMVSRLAVQILSMLVMTVVVLVAAAVVEKVTLDPPAYLLTLTIVIFSSAVFLGVGQALVGLVKSADTVNAVGRLSFLPLVALGLFAHSAIFGTTFETIARWSPGGAVATLLAGAMQPAAWSGDTWWALLTSVLYTIVFAGIGIRWFQWSTR